jgi:hypothetical protein
MRCSLIEGFSQGFMLTSGKQNQMSIPRNHPSAHAQPGIIAEILNKETSLGRVAGPFQQPPFDNFISSPLGLVPKKTPEEFRMIHDLSYPRGGSVNSNIPLGYSSVTYQLLDDAIAIIQTVGHGCLVTKADIESAFRLVPIHRLSYPLTGFQ